MSKGKPAGIKTPPDGSLRSEVDGFPLAVPSLELAAQLLARPLPTVENAAKKVEPYRHRDGHPVWSLRELPWPLAWSSRTQRPAPSKERAMQAVERATTVGVKEAATQL